MKFLSKVEILSLVLIFTFVILVTYINLVKANTRARDAQRRSDLRAISDSLEKYQTEFGFFPPDVDGKILACKGEKFESFISGEDFESDSFFDLLRGCNWGSDGLEDLITSNNYLSRIPEDPKSSEGISYLYLSNAKRFQIFTYLEGEIEAEQYSEEVVGRNLSCGEKICNFGLASGETPLNKSIEDYEIELIELMKENER